MSFLTADERAIMTTIAQHGACPSATGHNDRVRSAAIGRMIRKGWIRRTSTGKFVFTDTGATIARQLRLAESEVE